MKRILVTLLMALALASQVLPAAESKPEKYRIVFELTSEGSQQFEALLNNLENVRKALGPQTEMLVVAHGPGLGLVQKTNTQSAERMKALADQGVVFAACQNTMKRKKLTREDLLPFATTVDSGVAEVVRRQTTGWAYIKSGH